MKEKLKRERKQTKRIKGKKKWYRGQKQNEFIKRTKEKRAVKSKYTKVDVCNKSRREEINGMKKGIKETKK